ncbi:MAG: UDP-N-acetylglucosamine diphosphorylase [Opitutaceae bacterium]|nr:UDP-N-acetylglucosamine diphosphorylase [Opitutaceae bacterium]|tara:strand:- start:10546 stop:11229 length:684 start_codon:yes stop_codon:yes gene_type:complete
MNAEDLFSLPIDIPFADFFNGADQPWFWVSKIKEALNSPSFKSNTVSNDALPSGVVVGGPVYIDPTVKLAPNVVIHGPTFIGPHTEIRPGAYIRGNVIAGAHCVLGNSCEFKNSLLLNHVQVPHFSYVGDSVLGNGAHLGAGVICSNLRLDQANVWIKLVGGAVDSGLRKLGALIGDEAEVGCNSVLTPGCILGKRSLVYPSMVFGGVLDSEMIAGSKQEIRKVRRR